MFVRVSKEARIRLISFLESEGFQCVNNHVFNRQDIIESGLPLQINLLEKTISRLGNVTCAAAAASRGGALKSEDEFYEIYSSWKAKNQV